MSNRARIARLAELKAGSKAVDELEEFRACVASGPYAVRKYTGYEPRQLQQYLRDNERRFNVEVMHRRFGKTVEKINKAIEMAVVCPFPAGRYAYAAPTREQAEDIGWHYLKQFTERIPSAEVLESKLAVVLPTALGGTARVRLYGLDSPKQRLRGMYLDGFIGDEYAWVRPSVWGQQVRPMLSDKNRAGVDMFGRLNQWADFIFTPFGRNHAHTMYQNAIRWRDGEAVIINDEMTGERLEVRRDDWFAAMFKASETSILDENELAAAKIDIGSSKYEQEYECSFDAAIEGAIFARQLEEARAQGRIKSCPYDKMRPVNTAWDLGHDDATAIWFFQQYGQLIRFIDYYENSKMPLEHYPEVLAEKRYRYGYHLLPHDVKQGAFELGQGKNRKTLLRMHGVRVTEVPKVRYKTDSIAAAQALLSRSEFDIEKCSVGLDMLSLYRRQFNEQLRIFSQHPVHDFASHGADAYQTAAVGLKRLGHLWSSTNGGGPEMYQTGNSVLEPS